MKVLVTGGAGFIGSQVVDAYLSKGYDVVIVDNLSTGLLENINPFAKFYKQDIRSSVMNEIFASERPDYVNHHAAQMDVRRSVIVPAYDADVNILGAINLLECSQKYNVRKFIYSSTGGAVYGEPVYLPCDEKHPINPICPYGISKHTVEHYLYLWKELYKLPYVVLRYPNVYGPRQNPNGEAGVVAIFAHKMLYNKVVTINGDGEQVRDYVYVSDCVQANVLALSEDAQGIYNLGSSIGTSVNQIFSALSSITNYQQTHAHGPAKIGETRSIYLDATRAKSELGWKPEVALQDGLERVCKSLQDKESAN